MGCPGMTFTEHTAQYTNVVAIFIESYALLAVCYIANTIVWAVESIGIGAVLLAAVTEQVEVCDFHPGRQSELTAIWISR